MAIFEENRNRIKQGGKIRKEENPYKQLGGQTIIYGLGNIVPRVLNYAILTFYYTRRFSVEEFGVISELYAYVAIMLVIMTYGMETGLFKFSNEKYDKKEVFHTSFISVSVTSIVFWILIVLNKNHIAKWIGYQGNAEYLLYMGSILASDAIGAILFAKLRIENRVRKFAGLKIVNVVLTIVLVLGFLEVIPNIKIINETKIYKNVFENIGIGYVFIANMIASVFILLLLLKEYFDYREKVNVTILKRILKYSIPLMVAGLAGMLNESLDRIMLKNLVKEPLNALYELGIYAANYRIAVLMTLFIQMFRYAAEPFFFKYMKNEDAKSVYADVMKYFTIFMMVIFLMVSLYIDIFKYFIDEKYHEGLKVVYIVLFANILVGMLFNVNMWYKLTGKTIYGIVITSIGTIVYIGLNILFIPRYSYMACAWIHVIGNFIMLAITYYTGQRYYKIKYDIGKILLYVGFGMLLFIVGKIVRTESILINVMTGTILIGLYLYICNKKEKLIKVFTGKYGS